MIFTQEAPLTAKWFWRRSCIRIELEFGNVGFWGEGKPEYPEKNLSEQRGFSTNNKLNPHMTSSPGIEPGPHWWEASAFTTAPTLFQSFENFNLKWISQKLKTEKPNRRRKKTTSWRTYWREDTEKQGHKSGQISFSCRKKVPLTTVSESCWIVCARKCFSVEYLKKLPVSHKSANVSSTKLFCSHTNLILTLPLTVTWSGRGIKNFGFISALTVVLTCKNNTLCRTNFNGIPTTDGWTNFNSTGTNAFVKLNFLPERRKIAKQISKGVLWKVGTYAY